MSSSGPFRPILRVAGLVVIGGRDGVIGRRAFREKEKRVPLVSHKW
jgi:hypothetical protein